MATLMVKDILKSAMGKIGATAIDEEPTPTEYNTCLMNANAMLADWSVHKLMLRGTVTENFSLAANKGTYIIGPGGDFNTLKPIKIEDAFIRDSANEDYHVDIVTQEEFDAYPDKAFAQARPEYLFYDPGLSQQTSPGQGTINLYTIPDAVYQLFLVSSKYLTAFVNLTDLITFEDAYDRALIWNIALEIWPDFHVGKEPTQILLAMAKSSKRSIEQLNSRAMVAKLDVPTAKGGSGYDVYSDRY